MCAVLNLPNDTEKLKEQVHSLHRQNLKLEERIKWFERQMFGRKSEKRTEPDPQALDLFGRQPEATPAEETITSSRKKKQPGHGRNPLPEHLDVEEETLDVPEAEKKCPCCGRGKICIGEDGPSTPGIQ